ncbi:hypothetical protein ACLOJK_011321 [Asimina triloba]
MAHVRATVVVVAVLVVASAMWSGDDHMAMARRHGHEPGLSTPACEAACEAQLQVCLSGANEDGELTAQYQDAYTACITMCRADGAN